MNRSLQRIAMAASVLVATGLLSACSTTRDRPGRGDAAYRAANLRPYVINGRRYTPRIVKHYDEKGLASWYSYPPGTRRTATGEPFDPNRLSAAHKTLPLPCVVEVTNLETGKKIKVRVNDRGPFVDGRIIDLSRAAADRLGITGRGVAPVRVRFLGPAIADSGGILLAEAQGVEDPDAAVLF